MDAMNDSPPDRVDALDAVVFLRRTVPARRFLPRPAPGGSGAWGCARDRATLVTACSGAVAAPPNRAPSRAPGRLVVKLGLLATAAGSLAVSGEVPWAIGFLVVTAAVTIAGELRAARGGPRR